MVDRQENRAAHAWRGEAAERIPVVDTRPRPPRVIVTPLSPPLVHPICKRDIQLILSVLPAASTAGLRSVSLLGQRITPEGAPVFASCRRGGFLRLHAVSALPWRTPALSPETAAELRRYGARVETMRGESLVRWPEEALRLYYTAGILLPAIAHHRREHEGTGGEAGGDICWLGGPPCPWQATDLALRQWGELLRRAERA